MDHCASVLLAFEPGASAGRQLSNEQYDQEARKHHHRVGRLMKEHAAELAANGLNLLQHLDPALNSISYLTILDSLVPSDPTQATDYNPALAEAIVNFLCRFDTRQIRYAGVPFTNLFTAVGSGSILPASIAVTVLTTALRRLDPQGHTMTSNHLTLAKLAYHSNNVAPALPVISQSIVFYPGMMNSYSETRRICDPSLPSQSYLTRDTGLTTSLRPAQVLEYEYLVGLMFCSLRDWAAATSAFERIITFPSRDAGVSKVMVEAHKKWVLTSLLRSGKSASQPALVSGPTSRTFGILSKHYLQIAEHFDALDVTALRTAVTEHASSFGDDGNEGLVREILATFQQWQIYFLRDVYAKVSIAELRATTYNADTGGHLASDAAIADLVRRMISLGMLTAAIHEAEGGRPAYLEFLPESQSAASEAEYARALAASAQRLRQLKVTLGTMDERLVMGKEYARFQLKEQQRREKAGRDDGRGDPSGFDEQIEDEDLMGGTMSMH